MIKLDELEFCVLCSEDNRYEMMPCGIQLAYLDLYEGELDLEIPTEKYPPIVEFTPTSVRWGHAGVDDEGNPWDYTATIYLPRSWIGWEFTAASYQRTGSALFISARKRESEVQESAIAKTLKQKTFTHHNSEYPELGNMLAEAEFKKTMSEGRARQIMGNIE